MWQQQTIFLKNTCWKHKFLLCSVPIRSWLLLSYFRSFVGFSWYCKGWFAIWKNLQECHLQSVVNWGCHYLKPIENPLSCGVSKHCLVREAWDTQELRPHELLWNGQWSVGCMQLGRGRWAGMKLGCCRGQWGMGCLPWGLHLVRRCVQVWQKKIWCRHWEGESKIICIWWDRKSVV